MLGGGEPGSPPPSIRFFRLTQRKTLNSLAGLSSNNTSMKNFEGRPMPD
jgi:hypothetical protein